MKALTSNLAILVPLTLLLWGTEYTLVGTITPHMAESWQVVIRMLAAAILMVVFVYASGNHLPALRSKSWWWYGLMGFVGMTIPFWLIAKSYSAHVDSGLISILIGITPLFTVVLAHFFIPSEPLTKMKSLGFIIGFIGICVLFLPDHIGLALAKNWQAQLLVVLAAFGYALTSILGKRAPEQPASVGAALMLIGGAVSAVLCALWLDFDTIPKTLPSTRIIAALIALTLGATFLGNLLYLRLLQLSGPSLIAKINYVVPLVALVSGAIFLREQIQPRALIALAIISLGLWIAHREQAASGRKLPLRHEIE